MSTVKYRYDLDGLRGIAIAFVVLFHVFVGRVSGGVDVFLLLSGYFFLGSQLRYAERQDASLNLWWPLWRTIRRLVPLLVTVLTATVLAVVFFVPELRQLDLGRQLIASLFYYQNWELAAQGAEYGAASGEVSPLQHIWSMSVQGQFYLFAVVLGWAIAWILRRQRRARKTSITPAARIAGPILIAATAASFAYAVFLHQAYQPLNYYSTFSRMWELTLGAVLVLYAGRLKLSRWAREAFTGLGLAMVVTTGIFFDGADLFPGPWALYPLGGAALVILGDGKIAGVLASRFFRWLGSIAYALYLWHWPILILATVYLGLTRPPVWLGLAVIAVSVALADASHRFIEAPLRQHAKRPSRMENRVVDAIKAVHVEYTALLRAAGGATVALIAAGLLSAPASWHASVENLEASSLNPVEYPGARVLTGATAPDGVKWQPDPYVLADTVSPAWSAGCMNVFGDPPGELAPDWYTGEDADHCVFGDPAAEVTVFLVGGSHAEQWMAPLDVLGKEYGFRVIPYVRQSCPAFVRELDDVFDEECIEFNQSMVERIKRDRPDLVISNSTRPLLEKERFIDEVPRSYLTFWEFLARENIPFLGLRDNPWFLREQGFPDMVSQCLEKGHDYHECGRPKDLIYASEDPAAEYLDDVPQMRAVDTSKWFCPDDFCGAVMGNIYMWRDGNHMSDDFALSLTDLLWHQLRYVLPRAAGGRL
ncbi:acyltransferase family protein [Corynebacterium atypicum]|uniref:acyltransferase family protein n=1 Tax=Corynebacterium atypicum TaxID=191610 RepID=UPI001F3A02F5|nr:acyltransferase family protein [Corynebacterium atypicum]